NDCHRRRITFPTIDACPIHTTTPHPVLRTFFLKNPAPSPIYTLSLHDALPISGALQTPSSGEVLINNKPVTRMKQKQLAHTSFRDRKSTRLNSSHVSISYAVFCLKKKNKEVNGQEKGEKDQSCIPYTQYSNMQL